MTYVKVEFVCRDAEVAKELIDAGAELGLLPTDPTANTMMAGDEKAGWAQATQDVINNPGVTRPAGAAPQPDEHWPADNRTYDNNDNPAGFNPETDVDEKGFIYNPEIHASTKTTTKTGVWKRRQGVSKQDHDAKSRKYTPPAPTPTTETSPAPTGQPPATPVGYMPDGRPISGYDAYGNPIVLQQGAPTPTTETTPQPPATQPQQTMVAPGLHQAVPMPSTRTYASFTDAMNALNELVQQKFAEKKISTDPNAQNAIGNIYAQAGVDMAAFNDVARQQNDLPGVLNEIYKALRAFEVL